MGCHSRYYTYIQAHRCFLWFPNALCGHAGVKYYLVGLIQHMFRGCFGAWHWPDYIKLSLANKVHTRHNDILEKVREPLAI